MKEEIKEILDYLKDNDNWYRINNKKECNIEPYKLLLPNERNNLLDYITNLQEELDRCVKAINEDLEDDVEMSN